MKKRLVVLAAQQRAKESAVSFAHTRPEGQAFYTVNNITNNYIGVSEILTMYNSSSTDIKITSFKNSPKHNEFMLQSEGGYRKSAGVYNICRSRILLCSNAFRTSEINKSRHRLYLQLFIDGGFF